ncbi:glycoside hydrolase [Fomitiporia mediterranea MF3/22]|uniref:glycoside hydrolase n=1 Tax=Fomitiporia mediterranea (strain MF3/22) TaxID=694068 RepID=UPI0004409952|nr:glycoside hydrolase [Fomitiporia mediterranea MF3/22]EJC98805.1 glycoside hydrolase [Fomitiporia mediterranea MF3/22]
MLLQSAFTVFVLTILDVLGVEAVRPVPHGFATTDGMQFQVDGKPFNFVGANSYWLPLLTTQHDVELTFQGMQEQGIKVVRTWGFNAINETELAGAKESGLTYYQIWNSSQWVGNDDPQGLERLDNVVKTAAKYDLRLIITFTNNWLAYGGSDLFLNWIVGPNVTHDVFFTNRDVIDSYQRYVKTIVERYKDSPIIFAWELINEARCLSDTIPAGPNCVPGSNTLFNWYKEQSDFVRSLDPNHMITTGGEGHFFWKNPPIIWTDGVPSTDYNFNGQAGEDFDLDLTLPNIDFGVYHLYPQAWYTNLDFPGSNFTVQDWGLGWIQDHANSAKKAKKPLILEEFGISGIDNKTSIYPVWVQRALDTNHAIMPWQFGQLGLTEDGGNRPIKYGDKILNGASPNDGNTIYPNQTQLVDIFVRAAKILDERSG